MKEDFYKFIDNTPLNDSINSLIAVAALYDFEIMVANDYHSLYTRNTKIWTLFISRKDKDYNISIWHLNTIPFKYTLERNLESHTTECTDAQEFIEAIQNLIEEL